jgi:hypothetical protein
LARGGPPRCLRPTRGEAAIRCRSSKARCRPLPVVHERQLRGSKVDRCGLRVSREGCGDHTVDLGRCSAEFEGPYFALRPRPEAEGITAVCKRCLHSPARSRRSGRFDLPARPLKFGLGATQSGRNRRTILPRQAARLACRIVCFAAIDFGRYTPACAASVQGSAGLCHFCQLTSSPEHSAKTRGSASARRARRDDFYGD